MSARCEKHSDLPRNNEKAKAITTYCHDCNVAQMIADDTTMRERAEREPMPGESTATASAVLIAVPVELAEVDRDREITCALIGEAGNIVCHHDTSDTVSAEIVGDAKAFLSAWFKRKAPTLQMPAGFDRPL